MLSCENVNFTMIIAVFHPHILYYISFAFETSSLDAEMNFTPGDRNETVAVKNQRSLERTVGINVTIIVMGITINYINATMIHTFNKHHVRKLLLLHRKRLMD